VSKVFLVRYRRSMVASCVFVPDQYSLGTWTNREFGMYEIYKELNRFAAEGAVYFNFISRTLDTFRARWWQYIAFDAATVSLSLNFCNSRNEATRCQTRDEAERVIKAAKVHNRHFIFSIEEVDEKVS
jgi:hypothetical protein